LRLANYRVLITTSILVGCTPPAIVPVREQSTQAKNATVIHIVKSGDTVYSIAWANRVDYRTLAKWNGIQTPYFIKPGQQIRLKPPAVQPKPKSASPNTQPRSTNTQSRKATSAPTSGKIKITREPTKKVNRWIWPAHGKIIRRFSPKKGSSGVDIAGKSGTPIRAAAAGQVVYAGNGLRGYGNLVIIKHNQTYLSAYAHHRRLLVQEGNYVKQGQKIGEMGKTGSNRVKLHFEIRRVGNPTDPLRYLPK